MRIAIPCLLSLCVLSACKGESPSTERAPPSAVAQAENTAPTGPMPKACELVSNEEVNVLLVQEAGLMADDPENCMWASMESPGQMTMLMVQISQAESAAEAQTMFNVVAGMQGDLGAMVNSQVGEKTKKSGQEFDDLGDEAWLSSTSFGASFGSKQVGSQQLIVRKGARMLVLNVTGSTKIEGLPKRLESLARTAVAKL